MNAIYTAITGNYDRLLPIHPDFRKGWEAVCFTDGEIPAGDGGWKVVRIREALPPMALSKKIKALSHFYLPRADFSLWIDGSLEVRGPLDRYLQGLAENDMTLIRHPERNCVYEEMEACIRLNKADPESIRRQQRRYLAMSIPRHGGLYKAGVLLRRKTPRVIAFNMLWWTYTREFGTWRDQLTLPLALAEMNWRPETIEDGAVRPLFRQKAIHRRRLFEKDALHGDHREL